MTSATTRAQHKPRLDLIVRVKTTYRSVTGSRRQTVNVERQSEELDAKRLARGVGARRGPLSPKTLAKILAAAAAAGQNTTNNANGANNAKGAKAQQQRNTTTNGGSVGGGVPMVQRVQWMAVPEFLTEELWERHGYSLSDVRKTVDAFPARVIWQLVRSYNYPATNASSRVYCETDTQLTYWGKSTAVQKLLTAIKERHPEWEQRPSITWNMSKLDDPNGDGRNYDACDRHLPGLPVHRLNAGAFETMVANLVPDQKAEAGKERGIFSWRNIMIVPLELSRSADMLLVGRVIPWAKYVQGFGMPKSLRSCPNTILAVDGYYALMSETFYFYCPDSLVASSLPAAAAAAAALTTPATNPSAPSRTIPTKPNAHPKRALGAERPSKRAKINQ